MANHAELAGLILDISGAASLARGLASERAQRYARTEGRPTWWQVGGIDPERDVRRTRDAVDARVGLTWILAGFVGQAIGALKSELTPAGAAGAYAGAALVLGLGLMAHQMLVLRRQGAVFLALMLDEGQTVYPSEEQRANSIARRRRDLHQAYARMFSERGTGEAELEGWMLDAERELGHHPWRGIFD